MTKYKNVFSLVKRLDSILPGASMLLHEQRSARAQGCEAPSVARLALERLVREVAIHPCGSGEDSRKISICYDFLLFLKAIRPHSLSGEQREPKNPVSEANTVFLFSFSQIKVSEVPNGKSYPQAP